ncbi:MAG: YciI family protein [Phycisphaerae bacterium]|nr:YciI family protein [Gemmatimonadaceae bacterium]
MKFMVLVKASAKTEAGVMPTEAELVEMHKFNEQLVNSGIMLAGEGLHPSSKGARIDLTGSKPVVIDGPFTETKELLAGFWMVQVKSKEECIEWFKRCPSGTGTIEIRQVFDAADFAPAIETDAGRAVLAAEEAWRKEHNQ